MQLNSIIRRIGRYNQIAEFRSVHELKHMRLVHIYESVNGVNCFSREQGPNKTAALTNNLEKGTITVEDRRSATVEAYKQGCVQNP